MNHNTRKVLLGALIGIGRAAESSAHLIDRSLDLYILQALAACNDNSISDEEGLEIAQTLNEEKAILVPDCSMCAEPCGRTDDFNLDLLQEEAEPVIILKEEILRLTLDKASQLIGPARAGESLLLWPFYRALFSIGARDWSAEDLNSVIDELNSL